MKWGDYIKRTAVRRVVWIIAGLVVYAVLSLFGVARAQDYPNCFVPSATSGVCATRDEAYQAARQHAQYQCEAGGVWECVGVEAAEVINVGVPAVRYRYKQWNPSNGNERTSQAGYRTWATECAGAGEQWRDDLKQCVTGCADREPMEGSFRWTSSGSSYAAPCVDGCTYEETGGGLCAGEFCVGRGSLAPTGAQCSTGPTPSPLSRDPDGVCSPIGNNGAQHCVSSGDPARHCIVHASGLSQCWDGTETGPRVNRSGTEGASREMQPATPAPHPNQQAPQVEGSSTAKVSGTSDGGGTFNVVVISGNGNAADQGDNGSAPGQGSAPGWGNTIGQGPGNSDGTGEGEDGEGPGTPSPGISDDLYERDGRTLEQLYDEYRARVDNAPIVQALDGIFSPPQGGSCPIFSLPASAYWEAMVFDFHCREPLSDILALMGWVVLALAAYLAVRIAFE